MIEIRNDEIADEAGQALWADRLATILSRIIITAADKAPSVSQGSVPLPAGGAGSRPSRSTA